MFIGVNLEPMKKSNFFSMIIIIVFCFLIIFPLSTLIIWVFTERYAWPSILPQKFSLRALTRMLSNKDTSSTFFLSIFISSIVAFFSVVIGILTSRAFILYEFRGKCIFKFLVMFPFLVPTTVFAMGIQITFLRLGLTGNIYGVILCHIIYSLPYATRLIDEGMSAISVKYEEQARVLGEVSTKAFFIVTLPNLVPVILTSFTMAYIISFSQYFLTLLIEM